MILRTWRTRIDETRASEYERFASEVSSPMFHAHQGFRKLFFGREGSDCVVITIWESHAAVDALEASPHYQETVVRISATGLLVGQSQTERFELHGTDLLGT